MRSSRKGSAFFRFFSAQSQPPPIAVQLSSIAFSLPWNCLATALRISSRSMFKSHAATPT